MGLAEQVKLAVQWSAFRFRIAKTRGLPYVDDLYALDAILPSLAGLVGPTSPSVRPRAICDAALAWLSRRDIGWKPC